MRKLHVNYSIKDKGLIKKSIPFMMKNVLSYWKAKILVSVKTYDDDECVVSVRYTRTGATDFEEVMEIHEVTDVIQAFIEGVMYGYKKVQENLELKTGG